MTEREYLDIERKAEIRSEYIAGRIYTMSGASERHNLIAGNLYALVWSQLRGGPCRAYMSDLRVKVARTSMYTYPDIVAICGERRFEDSHIDTLLNPSLIVEVLSESTEAYDRGEKFAHFRRLETLREYVLIAQDKVRIEHYQRQGEQWVLSEISDAGDTLHLPAIDCHVAVAAIYENIELQG